MEDCTDLTEKLLTGTLRTKQTKNVPKYKLRNHWTYMYHDGCSKKWLIWLSIIYVCSVGQHNGFHSSADPEGGTGGPDPPPWKITIGPPPGKSWTPPPGKCWTPLAPLKMIDFFEIDHLTSVNKLTTKKELFCQTDLAPPDENSWIRACHYFLHQGATWAQVRLGMCADSPEPSLLAYTKYGFRWRLNANFRPLAWLDMLV